MAKLKEYRVKVIQHLIKGNKVAKSGDVLTEDKFINLKESLDGGYVELVKAETPKTAETTKTSKKAK